MLRYTSLFLLLSLITACGLTSDNMEGSHSKTEVVYKSLQNVVSGRVDSPPGKTLSYVELTYPGGASGPVRASLCQPLSYASPPAALYCEDNTFYFSGVVSSAFSVRAVFTDNTFIDSIVVRLPTAADVKLTQYSNWNESQGTTLAAPGTTPIIVSDQTVAGLYSKAAALPGFSYDLTALRLLLDSALTSPQSSIDFATYTAPIRTQLLSYASGLVNSYFSVMATTSGCATTACQDILKAAISPINDLWPVDLPVTTGGFTFELCSTAECQAARDAARNAVAGLLP